MNKISNVMILVLGALLMLLLLVILGERPRIVSAVLPGALTPPGARTADRGADRVWRPGVDPVAVVHPARTALVRVPFYSDHGPGRRRDADRERAR